MSRRKSLINPLLLAALLAACGCARSTTQPEPAADEAVSPPPPAEEIAKKEPASADTADDRLLQEATAALRLADELPGKPSAKPTGKPSSAPPPATPAAAAKTPPPRERFVIFTPQGPLVCELTITIDGVQHTIALDRLVDDALATAKSEQGASPLWSKLVASPRFRYGQFGNVAIKDEEERNRAIMRCDLNRDDVVDRDEMRRFLTRNQAGGGSLIVHAEDPNRDQSVLAAPLWQLLDADADQILSDEELQNASDRLRSRDGRDDESLSPDELAASENPAPMEPMRRLTSYLAVAHSLSDDTSWNGLLSTIEELYPEDERETESGTSWTAKFLEQLDSDRDGSLDAKEVAALGTREPDLRIDARLGIDPALALLKLIGLEFLAPASAQVHAEVLPSAAAPIKVEAVGDDLLLAMSRLTIEVSRSDTVESPQAVDANSDAQFKQFDRDANGYLDRDEFRSTGQAAGAFDGLDADGGETSDGKVYPDAWKLYLRRQRAAASSLIHVYVGSVPDPLFIALDADHDGRLGAREVAAARERLLSLDTSADHQLTADELPRRMELQLVRDNQPPDEGIQPRIARPRREVVRTGPAWFQRMDANGDGDISPREFLGAAGRFRELDKNGDGFIEASEASKVGDSAQQSGNAALGGTP